AEAKLFRLNIPRAKQRGVGFRGAFRSLPILEDLYLVLRSLHRQSVAAISSAVGQELGAELASEVPLFLNRARLEGITRVEDVKTFLFGDMPDELHAKTSHLAASLQRCGRSSIARSERTGE